MNSTPLPLFTVRAAVDSDGSIFNVSVWAELPTEDAAREVAARFPKSLRVVGSGLTCVRGRSVEERGLVSSSFYLTPNAVTGAVNESGLARLRRLMSRIEWRLDTESIANAADEATFRRLLAQRPNDPTTQRPNDPTTQRPMNPEDQPSLGQCCEHVRIPGHNFPRYKRCSRAAVTMGRRRLACESEGDVPLCFIHSPEGVAKRRARGEETEKKRLRAFYAQRGWPLPDHLR